METKIRIESYKLYWHAEQKHGGAAMLLAGTAVREVHVRVTSISELEALGKILSTFRPVFWDAQNQVLYTDLLAAGTTRDHAPR